MSVVDCVSLDGGAVADEEELNEDNRKEGGLVVCSGGRRTQIFNLSKSSNTTV